MTRLRTSAALAVLLLTLFTVLAVNAKEGVPSGTLTIDSTQIAFLVSGQLGGGKITFKKKTYPFKIGGLGIGGIGASKISATGTVYDLKRLEDFPGTYVQGRIGFAFTDKGKGDLWLKNEKGVVIRLKSRQAGLALTAGADGVRVRMDR